MDHGLDASQALTRFDKAIDFVSLLEDEQPKEMWRNDPGYFILLF